MCSLTHLHFRSYWRNKCKLRTCRTSLDSYFNILCTSFILQWRSALQLHRPASLAARGDLQHGGDSVSLTGQILWQGGGELFDVAKSAGGIDFGGQLYFVTPAWCYWSGVVGLHERANMKRSWYSLISAYCVTSWTWTDSCKQACSKYMPWGSVTVCATYRSTMQTAMCGVN